MLNGYNLFHGQKVSSEVIAEFEHPIWLHKMPNWQAALVPFPSYYEQQVIHFTMRI